MAGDDDTSSLDSQSGFEEAGLTAYAVAAEFGAAAFPPNMPAWLCESLERNATLARQAEGSERFFNPATIDAADPKSREQREKEANERATETITAIVADERRRQEAEWDRSHVAIGGIELTGEEWDQAYELLFDPAQRQKLIDRMTRTKGWSKDRADKAANDALTLAQIAQREKDGTITSADRTRAEGITRRNPDAAEMVKEAARMKNDRGFDQSHDSGSLKQSAFVTQGSATVGTAEIAAAPTDPALKGAPDLTARFESARAEQLAKPAQPEVILPPRLVANVTLDI